MTDQLKLFKMEDVFKKQALLFVAALIVSYIYCFALFTTIGEYYHEEIVPSEVMLYCGIVSLIPFAVGVAFLIPNKDKATSIFVDIKRLNILVGAGIGFTIYWGSTFWDYMHLEQIILTAQTFFFMSVVFTIARARKLLKDEDKKARAEAELVHQVDPHGTHVFLGRLQAQMIAAVYIGIALCVAVIAGGAMLNTGNVYFARDHAVVLIIISLLSLGVVSRTHSPAYAANMKNICFTHPVATGIALLLALVYFLTTNYKAVGVGYLFMAACFIYTTIAANTISKLKD